MCRELIESLIADYVKDAKEFLMADPVLREVSLGTMRKQKTADEIAQEKAEEAERALEEEAMKQLEREKQERDREERARIRRLAADAPRLEKELERSQEDYKLLRKENDELKVTVAKLQVQLAAANKGGAGNVKVVEDLDFNFGSFDDEALKREDRIKGKKADSPIKDIDELAMEPADVTMKLDQVFDDIPPNSKERAQFEDVFLDDMARALGIPRRLLQIKEIREGSVIVEFTIMPDLDDDEEEDPQDRVPPPMELAKLLEEQLADESSLLMTGLVTNSVLTIHSAPSSAASSAMNSARGVSPARNQGKYDPRQIRGKVEGPGLRQELAEARERRKVRDGEPTKEQKKQAEKQRQRQAKQAEKDAQALQDRLERQRAKQEQQDAELRAAEEEFARTETERLMREAELASGAETAAELEREPPSEYWWLAHQNHRLEDDMEVGSQSIGDPNRHVRAYFHTTFKEFVEERMNLARHAYPELMHLCLERGMLLKE